MFKREVVTVGGGRETEASYQLNERKSGRKVGEGLGMRDTFFSRLPAETMKEMGETYWIPIERVGLVEDVAAVLVSKNPGEWSGNTGLADGPNLLIVTTEHGSNGFFQSQELRGEPFVHGSKEE